MRRVPRPSGRALRFGVVGRQALMSLVVAASAVVVAGCGGGSQSADDIARALARAQTLDDVKRALDDIDDGFSEQLVRNAFCGGIDSIAEDGSLPSSRDWAGFLRNSLLVRGGVPDDALEFADEFGEALEERDNYSAGIYVRGCGFVG